jgi:phosphoribosylamine--glycine ligase
MGDPECQTILPLLKNDFVEILKNCIDENLKQIKLNWKNEKSICIVLTSKGYPDKFEKNILINNLENVSNMENQYIFHAGTKFERKKFFSNGGRVLNFVSINENFKLARKNALSLVKILNWQNGHYRRDIGYKVIDN